MEIKLIEQLGLNDLDVVEALIDDLENAVSLFNWLENINVSKNVREFFEKMQEFFPSTKNAYIESVKEYGEVLETVVIEDIFMPELLTLLAKNEDAELLSNMFNYFEEIINKVFFVSLNKQSLYEKESQLPSPFTSDSICVDFFSLRK